MRQGLHLACAALLVFACDEALSHGAFEGIGSFYGGLLHPVVVPAHLIALLATGLFVGQRGRDFVVKCLPLFIVACVAGAALSHEAIEPIARIVLLSVALAIGVLVAFEAKVPARLATVPVMTIGFVVSLDSAPHALNAGANLAALAGTCLGASAALIWTSGPVTILAGPVQRIGLRVAGSWVGACALLVLALAAGGRPAVGG